MTRIFMSRQGLEALPGSYVLYRLYDSEGRLLYVGQSCNLIQRLSDHQNTKSWWPQVSRIEFEYHHERPMLAEATAIAVEHPAHNIQRNPAAKRTLLKEAIPHALDSGEWWNAAWQALGKMPRRCAMVRREIDFGLSGDAACVLATIAARAGAEGEYVTSKTQLGIDANIIEIDRSIRPRRVDRAVGELMTSGSIGRRLSRGCTAYVLTDPAGSGLH